MKRRHIGVWALTSVVAFGFALAKCSDPNPTPANPDSAVVKPDGGGKFPDIGLQADKGTPKKDQALLPDAPAGSTAALESVANSVTLPTSSSQYAKDLDNNGTKDNKLGENVGTINTLAGGSFDLQNQLNDSINSGTFLLLLQVFADSIVNAPKTTVVANLGKDHDTISSNNFSGTAEIEIDSQSPSGLNLSGSIANGDLVVGPGTLVAPLPLDPNAPPTLVSLKTAYISGDIDANGISKGQLNGAIPEDEIDTKLLPALASMLTDFINDPNQDPTTVSIVKGLFDTNTDGVIDANEIKSNFIIGGLLKPDVDTDGDKKPDALSVGFGFTAVSCKIVKP
jgi:hypothetical protein